VSSLHPKIFISHGAAGAGDAAELAAALKEVGIEVASAESLRAGTSIVEQIEALIREADAVVMLIDPRTPDAPNKSVEAEWELALSASYGQPSKRLIPVVEAGATPPPFLRSYLWQTVPAQATAIDWRNVAIAIDKTLNEGIDSDQEAQYREKARVEWRVKLDELGSAVAPLAQAERESKK
jgi:TIR domain